MSCLPWVVSPSQCLCCILAQTLLPEGKDRAPSSITLTWSLEAPEPGPPAHGIGEIKWLEHVTVNEAVVSSVSRSRAPLGLRTTPTTLLGPRTHLKVYTISQREMRTMKETGTGRQAPGQSLKGRNVWIHWSRLKAPWVTWGWGGLQVEILCGHIMPLFNLLKFNSRLTTGKESFKIPLLYPFSLPHPTVGSDPGHLSALGKDSGWRKAGSWSQVAEVRIKGMISVSTDSCIFPCIEKHWSP